MQGLHYIQVDYFHDRVTSSLLGLSTITGFTHDTGRVRDGNWDKSKFVNGRQSRLCLRPLEPHSIRDHEEVWRLPWLYFILSNQTHLLVGLYDALLTWKQYLLPAWTWSKYLMRWHNTCSNGEGLTLTLYPMCNVYTPGRALVGHTPFSERCLRSYSYDTSVDSSSHS